jgi:hypothetical protein
MLDKYGNIITRSSTGFGECNICDDYGKLTEDHVPPKGSTKVKKVKMLSIHDALGVDRNEVKGRYSQNGVKFQTLCHNCNNKILGLNYDPHLNFFSSEVIQYLSSGLQLPHIINITSKPNLIARSVIGHMLAVDTGRSNKSKVISNLARYFLNPSYQLPKGIDIYYWVYPHKQQVLVRDAALVCPLVSFMLMKYFPLAFMLTIDAPKPKHLYSLNPLLSSNPDQERNIPVSLSIIPPARFPEAPDTNGAVLYGQAAMMALPKNKKSKKL